MKSFIKGEKKVIIAIISLIILMCTSTSVFAEDIDEGIVITGECGDYINYTLYDNHVLKITGEGDMYTWGFYNDVPWYNNRARIKEVIIDENITSIGKYAFYNCTNLKKITIPEGINKISDYMFYGCSELTDVYIPESLKTIGEYAFYNCTSLEEIYIPEIVTTIGRNAFYNCSSLSGIELPTRLSSIESYTFFNCTSLKSIDIPSSVKKIGYGTFSNCGFSELVLPDSIKTINNNAFSNIKNLERVKLPANLKILEGIFAGCSNLKEITIPETVEQIYDDAFNSCSSLEEINIPESVTLIGEGCFAGTRIKTFDLPPNLTELELSAFSSAYSISVPVSVDTIIARNVGDIRELYYEGDEYDWEMIVFKSGSSFESFDTELFNNVNVHFESFNKCKTEICKPTCIEAGILKMNCDCSLNNDYTIEYADALGHIKGNDSIVTPPTCIEKGYTTYTCDVCEDTYIENYVDSTGHNYVKEIVLEPTCENDGVMTYTCKNDNTHTYTETIPAKGHIEVTDKTVPATCITTGLTEGKHCFACNEVLIAQESIPAIGHSFCIYNTTTKASFTSEGTQTAYCQNENCTETKTISIPALKTPTLSTTAYTFNNKVKKPTVTVRNTEGTTISKSVTYASGRKNVGKYAVKVKVNTADYEGTKTVYFKINPKGASNVRLAKGKKSFTVKWGKPSSTYRKQMTGYQIKYSTSSKMSNAKTVTVKNTTATSKTIKSLKAKKKYYVQVRTYKKIGSSYYYSGWSGKKTVTTK